MSKHQKNKNHVKKQLNNASESFAKTTESNSNFLQILICAFVVIMPLLFCKWNDQSPFEMIKAYFSTLAVCLMLGIYLVKTFLEDKIVLRTNIWLIGLSIYTVAYLTSFAFAGNYYSSIWGVLNLPAGSVMTVLTFVVLSFLAVEVFTDKEGFKTLAKVFVFTAFIMSIYGVIQHFGGDPINWWVYNEMEYRALSTMGQPVGFGTVVGCCLPLCFVFLINAKDRKGLIFWIIAFVTMNMGLMYSGSRLPIFGYFIVMFIYLGFLLIFRKKLHFLNWKKVGLAYALVVGCAFVYYLDEHNALKEKLEVKAIKTGYGTRFITWGTAFEMWKQHPLLGVGPENFGEQFNRIQTVEQNYGESWNLIWHKAHNEFIHYLATTGAVGFAAYLMLIVLMFVPVFKILRDKDWTFDYLYSIALLGGFGFLLLTHMTAFSFIPTLMFFYLFPAMNFNFSGLGKTVTLTNKLTKKMRLALSGIVICVLTFVMYIVSNVWFADMNYNDARRQLIGAGNFDAANVYLEKAIEQNPWNAEYWCFRSDVYYNFLARSLRDPKTLDYKKQELFNEIVKSSDRCVEMDSGKSDLWRARGTLFLSLAQMAPPAIDKSIEAFQKAIEVFPNSPYNHLSLANVYRKKGRNDLAVASLKMALSKRRDMIPVYVELFSIYYQEKRKQDIVSALEEIKNIPNLKKSEFYRDMPNLIKVAYDNGDKSVVRYLVKFRVSN
ncbi:MAG: O-antigen ligase family protein [Pseudobdellovibrio sp.]